MFQAINAWRGMPRASEAAASQAAGSEQVQEATLMGLNMDKNERRSENDIIAMRVIAAGL